VVPVRAAGRRELVVERRRGWRGPAPKIGRTGNTGLWTDGQNYPKFSELFSFFFVSDDFV
jgi:hypothetical protein